MLPRTVRGGRARRARQANVCADRSSRSKLRGDIAADKRLQSRQRPPVSEHRGVPRLCRQPRLQHRKRVQRVWGDQHRQYGHERSQTLPEWVLHVPIARRPGRSNRPVVRRLQLGPRGIGRWKQLRRGHRRDAAVFRQRRRQRVRRQVPHLQDARRRSALGAGVRTRRRPGRGGAARRGRRRQGAGSDPGSDAERSPAAPRGRPERHARAPRDASPERAHRLARPPGGQVCARL